MSSFREIAKTAGVSLGTVARYFKGEKLKFETENAISLAVRRLNRNVDCEEITRINVGVVIRDMNNLFVSAILHEIQKNLFESNCNLILFDTFDTSEKSFINLQRLNLAGLIVYLSDDNDAQMVTFYQNLGVSTVLFDVGGAGYKCDQVVVNNYEAMQAAVKHIISYNHSRIALLYSDNIPTLIQRKESFVDTLKAHGLDCKYMRRIDVANDDSYDAVKELMSMPDKPTVIVGSNHYITFGIMRAFMLLGISVPENVSLVGFDDFINGQRESLKLTCVQQPIEDYGKEIVKCLLKRITGDMRNFPTVLTLKCSFCKGATLKKL